MGKKRGRLDIVEDMLLAIQKKGGEIKPTHLMYKSNLSYKQMNIYLEELMEKDFVEKKKLDERELIVIKDRGYHFLSKIKEMRQFEETFGLDD
ncbi:hypothetical protein K9L67_04070 [Candidatus Woesearchaeota archaeon]|nr:hypothetical protein [Candidatus Woesearchaeota archaeon]MCF7901378.1 hypothetical protein [Candidatus Woesearchaeota archaeon]MCF8013151.1 hypothetical protein [Candidatus Woesearchaeota archaeon]